MSTAAIHLKFTSLAKIRSKCYLEILPEVTNMQNLDKIKWKEDIDTIEYLIPVTYKIILKKLNNLEDDQNALKCYHSCVDLVSSSSFTNTNKANDIAKHISEHKIHNNSFNKINTSVTISKPTALSCIDNSKETESVTELKATSHVEENRNDISIIKDLLEIINATRHTRSIGTLTNFVQHSSAEIKNLTIAPVCKIDTYEEIVKKEPSQNTDSLKHIVPFEPHLTIPKETCNKAKCLGESEFIYQSPCCKFPFVYHKNAYRTAHPNIRVAYYKSVIEKEILPLKVILQDLVAKCATFGLLKSSPKNQIKCINDNETSLFDSKKICNRVVYSIVFDK